MLISSFSQSSFSEVEYYVINHELVAFQRTEGVLMKSLNFTQTLKHIILMGKRELVALLNLSSWCLVMAEWLFLAVPWGCLRFVIVVFSDHTHLLFLSV